MHQLPPKDANERKLLRFWVGDDLQAGETISGATVGIELLTGVDATPEVVLDGVAVIDNEVQEVQQWIQGGAVNADYKLRCLATASSGAVHLVSARLPVRRL